MNSNPNDESACYRMAQHFYANNQIKLAKDTLISITKNTNCTYESLYFLGNLYLESGNLLEAIETFGKALQKNQTYEANFQIGFAFIQMNDFKKAIHFFNNALKILPDGIEALINIGAAYRSIGECKKSLEYFDSALKIAPNEASLWLNKGVALAAMGQFEDAIFNYSEAIRINKNYLEAYSNKGNAEIALGLFNTAHQSFQAALRISPGDIDTISNYSVLKLAEGNFTEGWRDYEARFDCQEKIFNPFSSIPRLSTLQHIENKRILVWAEQGLGDSIQFYRYLYELESFTRNITFVVQGELVELFKNQKLNIKIVGFGEVTNSDYDLQCPLMSLPLLFKTDKSSIPSVTPYITSDIHKKAYWSETLSKYSGLKVGLTWSGGYKKDPNLWAMNERRNVPFSNFYRLLNLHTINYFCLQKGHGLESIEFVDRGLSCSADNFHDYSGELHSFSDTAAFIDNLDLVISVDTSVAHLTGALGKPIWILNRFDSCWRWLINRTDSPWYSTAKIYNQSHPNEWTTVINTIEKDLIELSKH
jgi:tetratricopeptide (TPR) repeat protein